MKALSIRAPWPWFILYAGKDIENRVWHASYKGPLLIHVSRWWDEAEVREDFAFAKKIAEASGVALPPVTLRQLREAGGSLVGRVRITGCSRASISPWFFGPWGFGLADPMPLVQPVPCRGARGFFDVSDVMREARQG